MTDTELLKKIIKETGTKKGFLVKKLDISYKTLARKMNNESSFKADEIQIICDELHIVDSELRDKIFFAKDVDKTPTILKP